MSRIIGFYQWLYYQCFLFAGQGWGKSDLQWVNAGIIMTAILTVNLLALGFLQLSVLPGWRLVPSGLSNWQVGFFAVAVLLAHLAFLRYEGRYKRIIGKYAGESVAERRRGERLFGWYFVISLFAPFVIALAMFAGK